MITAKTSLIETVQSMYAAFGRGDISGVLAGLAPEIKWGTNVDPRAPGASRVPLFRTFSGPNDVVNFFAALSQDIQMHSFEPVAFMSNSLEVAARIFIDFTVRSTGHRARMEAMHHFTFNAEGRVVRFREFSDTLLEAQTWGLIQESPQK